MSSILANVKLGDVTGGFAAGGLIYLGIRVAGVIAGLAGRILVTSEENRAYERACNNISHVVGLVAGGTATGVWIVASQIPGFRY